MCHVSGKNPQTPVGSRKWQAQYMFSASVRHWSVPRFHLPVLGHVSVTELGQGQKTAALVEAVKPRNKEMNKVNIMITHEEPVFFNNVSKLLFHYASYIHPHTNTQVQRHTMILLHFYLHTCILPQRRPIVEKIKE